MELQYVGLVVQTVGAGLLAVDPPVPLPGQGQPGPAGGRCRLALPLPVPCRSLAGPAPAGSPAARSSTSTSSSSTWWRSCVAAIRMDRDVSLAKPLAVAGHRRAAARVPRDGRSPAPTTRFFAGAPRASSRSAGSSSRSSSSRARAPGSGGSSSGLLALLDAARAVRLRRRPVAYRRAKRGTRRRAPRRLRRLLRRPARDALRHRPDHLGHGGHRAAPRGAPRPHGRRHAALEAQGDGSIPLTETHNRFFLDEVRPQLEASDAGGSIVLIDVDGLKRINDTEGHEEGDRAIWTVADGDQEARPRQRPRHPLGRRRVPRHPPGHGRGARAAALLHASGQDRRGQAVAAAGRPSPTRSSSPPPSAFTPIRSGSRSTSRSRRRTASCTSASARTASCAGPPGKGIHELLLGRLPELRVPGHDPVRRRAGPPRRLAAALVDRPRVNDGRPPRGPARLGVGRRELRRDVRLRGARRRRRNGVEHATTETAGGLAARQRPAPSGAARTTTVAPEPPRSGGASKKSATSARVERNRRTSARRAPVPFPWMRRTSR